MGDNPNGPIGDKETRRIMAEMLIKCCEGLIPADLPVQEGDSCAPKPSWKPIEGGQHDASGRATFEQVSSMLEKNSRR